MKNIISAYKVDNPANIKDYKFEIDQDDDSALVYFFIFSQLGKIINKFFPSKVLRDLNFEDTIVFIAGTEFLVCKREQVYDQ